MSVQIETMAVKLLLEKYGPTLDMEQLGEVLHIEKDTVENRRMAGKLGIPTFKLAGPRLVYVEDVAKYLEDRRQQGIAEDTADQAKLAS